MTDLPSGRVRLTLNGAPVEVARSPDRSLLALLRYERNLTGAKYGCGEGECGACTVVLDGEPARACQVPVAELDGASVVTVEGLAPDGALTPIQRAFAEAGAFQCGFCTPGMVVRATALLAASPHPSDEEVRAAMDPNLCRCGGYSRILTAVRRAAEASDAREGR